VRRIGRVEAYYFNGETVLLGRVTGIPNALLQRLSNSLARTHQAPGSVSQEEFLGQLVDLTEHEAALHPLKPQHGHVSRARYDTSYS